jgi:hypothetical protein
MSAPGSSFCVAPMFDTLDLDRTLPARMAHDATFVFKPYMAAYASIYSNVTTRLIYNHKNKLDHSRSQAPAAVAGESVSAQFWHAFDAAPDGLDAVVYFGHGWPSALLSIEVGPKSLPILANKIRSKCNVGVTVVLYACLAGDWKSPHCFELNGRNACFASHLAQALSGQEAVVIAHSTAGHATTNAHVHRFWGSRHEPMVPGGMVGLLHQRLLTDTFENGHKKKGGTVTNLWARLPFMTPAEVQAEIHTKR